MSKFSDINKSTVKFSYQRNGCTAELFNVSNIFEEIRAINLKIYTILNKCNVKRFNFY